MSELLTFTGGKKTDEEIDRAEARKLIAEAEAAALHLDDDTLSDFADQITANVAEAARCQNESLRYVAEACRLAVFISTALHRRGTPKADEHGE